MLAVESEEALALDVGIGDVDVVETRCVIMEDAEQVIVIGEYIMISLRPRWDHARG